MELRYFKMLKIIKGIPYFKNQSISITQKAYIKSWCPSDMLIRQYLGATFLFNEHPLRPLVTSLMGVTLSTLTTGQRQLFGGNVCMAQKFGSFKMCPEPADNKGISGKEIWCVPPSDNSYILYLVRSYELDTITGKPQSMDDHTKE